MLTLCGCQAPAIVVVGQVDGTVAMLDAHTGQVVGEFDTGGPIVRMFRGNKDAPMVIASSPGPSRLYMFGSGRDNLQMLNTTLTDLVARTPFQDAQGRTFLGSFNTRLYSFDPLTKVSCHSKVCSRPLLFYTI